MKPCQRSCRGEKEKEMQIVNRRNIIIAVVVVVLIIIGAITALAMSGPINASPYTKVALKKTFSGDILTEFTFPSGINPNTGRVLSPLDIQSNCSKGAANILVYVYYACEDYQAGHINKKEFFQVMNNTRPAMNYLIQTFNTNNSIVLKYPQEEKERGLSYVEIYSDGQWGGNTVNFTKLQGIIFTLLTSMYQSQDPTQIYNDVKQFGAYMEMGTFYFEENNQWGMEQINPQGFKLEWITNNAGYSASSLQETLKKSKK